MPGWKDIANIWKNVKEVDLRPIRQEVERQLKFAIVGEVGSGRQALAEALRSDPARPNIRAQTPVIITDLEESYQAAEANLIILLLDPARADLARYRTLAYQWSRAGKRVVVFFNQGKVVNKSRTLERQDAWDAVHLFAGATDDPKFLQSEFVPVVMKLLPDDLLSLGRNFPLFRVPIAHHLISDACFANATYALSTGLAESVPVLNLPLNIADMVVLTKAQAFLVYRQGLTLGFSTRWQDYVAEFGSVIGGGFFWRQVARQLVGLIPVWGIIPKVAVAYAGTYVVGHVVLRWYLTGRHVSPKQVQDLYRQAFARGKTVASNLLAKAPQLHHRRWRKTELSSPEWEPSPAGPTTAGRTCANCGMSSATDAKYCQYCGKAFSID